MKCVLITLCLILLCVCLNEGKDFIAGTKANNLLISTQKLKYRSIPLIRRDKDYTYIDSKERIIKVFILFRLFTIHESTLVLPKYFFRKTTANALELYRNHITRCIFYYIK